MTLVPVLFTVSQCLREWDGYGLFQWMSGHCEYWNLVAAWPSRQGDNILQRFINACSSQAVKVKGHATGSLWGSPHTKNQLGQPLALFLQQFSVSCTTTRTLPPVIFNIHGIDYPVPTQACFQEVRGQLWCVCVCVCVCVCMCLLSHV